MMANRILPLMIFLTLFTTVNAQPVLLKSSGAGKTFQLKIYYGTEGKGAFVQYVGQQSIIPLKLTSRKVQTPTRHEVVKSIVTYTWDELLDGKVNGSYGLTGNSEKVSKAWYKRKADGKQFQLIHSSEAQELGADSYLLHGVMITFQHTMGELLTFTYPNKSIKTYHLPDFDHPDPLRNATIADYNFDGYDDVAFSIPDAGMGVYRTFSIFLYDPLSKRFQELAEPNDPRASCSGLYDVTLDTKNKLLMTSCRGAAKWWRDVYRYTEGNKLKWLRTTP